VCRKASDVRGAIAGDIFKRTCFPEAQEAVARVAKALGATCRAAEPRRARGGRLHHARPPKARSLHLDRLRSAAERFRACGARPLDCAGAMMRAPYVDKAPKIPPLVSGVLEIFGSVDVILGAGDALRGAEARTGE